MNSNSIPDQSSPAPSGKVTVFVALTIVAVAMCGAALYLGNAPYKSQFVSDWFDWARGDRTWSGVFVVGLVLLLTGLVGTVVTLVSAVTRSVAPKKSRPAVNLAKPRAVDTALSVPAENTRGSLKFDAETLATSAIAQPSVVIEPVTPAPAASTHPTEIQSLEPAIFSDNASDSFLTREPVAVEAPKVAKTEETPARTMFNPDDALSETHGLQVTPTAPTTGQVIPIRPEIQIPGATPAAVEASAAIVEEPVTHDPLEAALLRDAPLAAPTAAPQSDINAVITSAMRFIETPEPHLSDATPVEELPVVESLPEVGNGFQSIASDPTDDQSLIRQAVQMALSVWPDATRAIAADELNVRVSYLYYDKTPGSRKAFEQISHGDLSVAATTLQSEADTLAASGEKAKAAELWRVIGALHMGRDDNRALTAYEKVSELDPTDANIHVYLARRYQMNNDQSRQLPVLTRALAVVGDPATRLELLNPYADLLMKNGDVQKAGDAFEELGRLHETRAYLKPDDVGARSAQAISLARGAQAREMQGAFDLAGMMYKKAHRVFSDLSSQMPEHAGLRAMADNARRDADRFNMA